MSSTEYSIFLSASFLVAIITFVMGILPIGLKAKGANLFGILMMAIALWCLGTGGQMISRTEATSLVWITIQMLGVVLVPPLWFLFTMVFSGRDKRIYWWTYVLLFANSVVVMGFLLVPTWRPLLVEELIYTKVNGYLVNTEWILGPYFFIHLAFMFVMILLGDVVILRHAFQWPKTSRKKLITIIIATIFPLFTNLALVFNFFPQIHGNLDIFGFSLSGTLLGIVLYLDKILEIQPVAVRQLVEELPDALLVFNADYELIQLNPVAKQLLGEPIKEPVRDHFVGLLKETDLAAQPSARKRFVLAQDDQELHFDILVTPSMVMGRTVGYFMLLRDVSELIRSMEQLELLATTDPLTGLYNRRFFHLEGERIIALSVRYQHPVCVMTFDLDHFKKINDQFGHPAGDQVLESIADILRTATRKTDICARFGGDEFFLLLPESPIEFAISMAIRLQTQMSSVPFIVENQEIYVSASFGIAVSIPKNENQRFSLDELIRVADQKLYDAKQNGRNTICY